MAERAAVHAIVKGRVQGVGYRYFALREAQEIGVSGYARNLPDRTVEVAAEGSPESVELYVDRLRQGPSHARVDEVIVNPAALSNRRGFEIR